MWSCVCQVNSRLAPCVEAYVDVLLQPPRVLLRCGGGGGGGGGIGVKGWGLGDGEGENAGGASRRSGDGGGNRGRGGGDGVGGHGGGIADAASGGGDATGGSAGEGKGWRVAAPPPGEGTSAANGGGLREGVAPAPLVWSVPAGIQWQAPYVEVGSVVAQYAGALGLLYLVVRQT